MRHINESGVGVKSYSSHILYSNVYIPAHTHADIQPVVSHLNNTLSVATPVCLGTQPPNMYSQLSIHPPCLTLSFFSSLCLSVSLGLSLFLSLLLFVFSLEKLGVEGNSKPAAPVNPIPVSV